MSFMNFGRTLWGAIWIIAMATAAPSSDYQLKTVQVQPVESYPARLTIHAVTVAVDPYPTDEKSHTAFDVRGLNSKGYFPLHVIIRNSSSAHLALRTRNIVLVTAGGQELYTTPATILVQDIFKSSFLDKLPKIGSRDQSTSTKTGSPLLDFTGKELTNISIDPGAVVNGFIFFFTTEPRKNLFAGSKLRIPSIRDETDQKDLGPYEIALDPALTAQR